jgi:GNAT superfamily N-acetyltransferase
MENHSIRRATEADLSEIRAWLKQEDEEGVEGCFWCNFNCVETAQTKGKLTVLALRDKPVAFCVSSPEGIDVFEVKADVRGKGYGRILAGHVIAETRESGSMGMIGQCNPEDSLGFWTRMGFERVRERREGLWIALPFRSHREMPDASSTIRIQLSNDPKSKALKIHESRANLGEKYLLEDTFVEYVEDLDTIITIWIDGKQVFHDRVMYADEFNIERDEAWVRVTELPAGG